ncbi:hypothetical protein HETIRDRAFT_430510 [Heterobasidion irregulare TC 32-1]|uniref:Uncharacterized protein n=1 Tax=Heterobasidion irregulare (strain TC 32-1) TaxID=747525 RepID=W4JRD9_HETIT|nr:uncharacterized protein HETIRDRAFT_430510 [Heterobasidion irregulare TC 32-1]ETW76137.1 hypothetical protein HETIRDRAFT_430510 [Heterobasidion irregulare TC 32-1]
MLYLREFLDAIKAGDSGCIVNILKEHLNFWIKVSIPILILSLSTSFIGNKDYYQAHRSGALTLGAKQGNCHTILDVTNDTEELMGSLAHHAVYTEQQGCHLNEDEDGLVPDIISEGYMSLSWGGVTPLKEFNTMLTTLQHCCHVKPLVGAHNGLTLPMPNSIAAECISNDNTPAKDNTTADDTAAISDNNDDHYSIDVKDTDVEYEEPEFENFEGQDLSENLSD